MATVIKELRTLKIPLQDVPHGLPKTVNSLCPNCNRILSANIYEKDKKVYMDKICPEHGYFRDLISSDAELYLKAEKWTFEDGKGILNPQVTDAEVCPLDCGLCQMHKSNAALTNIDLTNRCNLNCPICFASASIKDYVYEPSFEQVLEMLKVLKAVKPIPTSAIQFSGGEPTIHPRFLDILRAARDMGFTHLQAATNGIRIGRSLEYAHQCKEAGLYTVYLQFDGIGDEPYEVTRGVALWELKRKVVENCRAAGLKIVLVPTIVNSVNDDQIGEILRFAIENVDVISGISYQPVAFTGRIAEEDRERQRFTLADLARCIEEQTGYISAKEDWYPLSVTSPFSKFIAKIKKRAFMEITCHSDCGLGTYLFVNNREGCVIPITQLIDIEGLMTDFNRLASKREFLSIPSLSAYKAVRIVKKHFRRNRAPSGLSEELCLSIIETLIDKNKRVESPWNLLLVAGMHFQDGYNYNVDRVRRCTIHYVAPDGKLYPFCAYNAGPTFRNKIERTYSVPVEEWKKRKGEEYITSGFYEG
ncbi:MAG TPA: radical SAM protein [Candidatus Latescibacteria bacterium]|nr:radical SAM protein [Candidatus Latescibacterota bacterium]